MIVLNTSIPDVVIIEPRRFADDRGFFLESFNEARFAEQGLPTNWKQDNHARSASGVLRGLHYQLQQPQAKLITVVHGTIYDVAVDIRRGSPTFGKWTSVTLSGDTPRFVYIPAGFAHGYCVLSETADVTYKCTDLYLASDDHGVPWNDPTLGIPWPIGSPIISAKDGRYEPFSADRADFPLARSA